MRIGKVNILHYIGMLVIALVMVFTLSGCSKDPAVESSKSDAEFAEEHRSCWQDKILTLLYDTMGKVAMGSYAKITGGAMSFMMVAFAFWFVIRLMKFVASPRDSSQEAATLFNEVLKKLFICLVCGLIASSSDGLIYILNMVIFPIYSAFLEFGSKVLAATSETDLEGNQVIEVFGEQIKAGKTIVCSLADGDSTALDSIYTYKIAASLSGFPSSPRDMMNCLICAVNERLTLGVALSFKIMRLKGFMVLLIGFIILCTFLIIKLSFVFYMVDSIFRFTLIIVILPLLVMAYAFGPTKEWAVQGFKVIISSAAFMMVIAILISIALLTVMQILQDYPDIFNPQDEKAEDAFKEFNPAIMSLLLISFLVKSTLSVAQRIVSTLIKTRVEANSQKKLKAALALLGKSLLAIFSGGASSGLNFIQKFDKVRKAMDKAKNSRPGKAISLAYNKYKSMQASYQNFQSKLNRLAGRDE